MLFTQAVAALKAGQNDAARRALIQVVRADPRHESGWLALASTLTDPAQRADCLRRALALNPQNAAARQALMLAELQAELAAGQAQVPEPAPEPEVPIEEPGDRERAVPRLGRFLLDNRLVTPEQLRAALLAQREAAENGQPRRLGEVLVEQGAISEAHLQRILNEQKQFYYGQFRD
ncbi:MAG: hypothetical protein HY784_17600 [Chloroflexi bacterium]|nr:hypothetical protein [Chloroflexota bacterium]